LKLLEILLEIRGEVTEKVPEKSPKNRAGESLKEYTNFA